MKIFKLEKIQVYQESLLLVANVYLLIKKFPLSKDFSLVDQLKRAAVSIPANIAERFGRSTKKDFANFLSIALGSNNEVIALLEVIKILYPKIYIDQLKEEYIVLGKRIYTFRQSLVSQN